MTLDPGSSDKLHEEFAKEHPSPAVPEKYARDPRLHGKLFYVFPIRLIKALRTELGERLSNGAWGFETDMAAACPPPYVGFWGGSALMYHGLCPEEDPGAKSNDSVYSGRLKSLIAIQNPSTEQVEEYYQILKQLSVGADWEALRLPRFAYAGWLLSNPTFQEEHDAFFDRNHKKSSRLGLPILAAKTLFVEDETSKIVEPYVRCEDSEVIAFTKDFEDFCVRWRLNGMMAPYLPVPASKNQGFPVGRATMGHLADHSTMLFVPDIYPSPTRAAAHDLLASCRDLVPDGDDHLDGWRRIVSKQSPRNQLSSYARRFRLLHYYCVLNSRYANNLKRAKGRITEAFATFLEVSSDSIADDLKMASEHLGSDWESRLLQ